MKIQLTDSVVRSESVMTAPIDDEIVIMSLTGSSYISMDCIGRSIWDHLGNPICVQALCARLQEEYQGPAEQIEQDVLEFLEQLKDQDAVDIVN